MTRSSQQSLVVVAVTIAATLGAPLVVVGVLLGVHTASYDGVCGPYPTDIPAFPCALDEYVAGFFEPFAALGLIVISLVTATLAALVSALGGLVWILVSARSARES